MTIVEKKPVPIYESVCPECKSVIRYKASEVSNLHITCPVCGVSMWAEAICPVNVDESNDGLIAAMNMDERSEDEK